MTNSTITTVSGLVDAGLVDPVDAERLGNVAANYAIAVTPTIANQIPPNSPNDPLALQFIPRPNELDRRPEETPDPISDEPFSPIKGIVHRYQDRALLKVVNTCPVYCRFCFRREMVGPGQGAGLTDSQIDDALAYVSAQPMIEELIMTGGDPLILSARRLKNLTAKIARISTLKKIRWHTRVPVVMPEKITADLTTALTVPGRQIRIALHANHAREFSTEAVTACKMLRAAGIELLSQSVLLKGINDNAETLVNLMEAYSSIGAQAYYLHHGDLAPGTSHFRTTIADGMALMRELGELLPSSMQPSYILDVPGGSGKVDLNEASCIQQDDGSYQIRCPDGRTAQYRDIV